MKQLEARGLLQQGNDADALTRDDLTNSGSDDESSMQGGGALNLRIDDADNGNNNVPWNLLLLLALGHCAGVVANAPAHTSFTSHNNAPDGSSVSSRISFDLNSRPGRDADGSCVSSRISFDLNSSPGRDAASIMENPVQNKGRQSMLNLNLNLNEIPILEDVEENVEESDLQGNKEQLVLVRELSEMENHKPEKTGELVAEANKTPQQNPRRIKPRPRVVVEGQAKRANKPRSPNAPGTEEIKAEKRKYTPRKGVDKPAATPLDEGSRPEMMSPGSSKTPKVDRKRPKRNRGDEDSNATNPETTPPGSKADAQLTELNISYDLINDETGKSISQPGTQIPDPSNPSKIDLRCDKLMDGNQTKCTKGKCKIIFSDATHDKEDYLPEMPAP